MLHKHEDTDTRVESLRQLVAGTAHDLNNLLVLVNGCAELALTDEALSPRARQLVKETLDAGERATSLTRRLLSLGRPPALRPARVDVAALLMSSASLLGRLIGDGVRLKLDASAAPLWVLADTSQLEQVIVNLVLNARDAMSAGGTLAISARAVTLQNAGTSDAGRTCGSERAARLTVTDSGHGIDPAVRDRMYEPYVTTKASDKHSGLGLAVVRGIVEQLGGSIDVTSTAGSGTTFTIDLPLTPAPGASS